MKLPILTATIFATALIRQTECSARGSSKPCLLPDNFRPNPDPLPVIPEDNIVPIKPNPFDPLPLKPDEDPIIIKPKPIIDKPLPIRPRPIDKKPNPVPANEDLKPFSIYDFIPQNQRDNSIWGQITEKREVDLLPSFDKKPFNFFDYLRYLDAKSAESNGKPSNFDPFSGNQIFNWHQPTNFFGEDSQNKFNWQSFPQFNKQLQIINIIGGNNAIDEGAFEFKNIDGANAKIGSAFTLRNVGP